MADTKPELAIMEEEGEHYEPEGIMDTSLPVEPRDGSSEDKGSGGPPLYLGHMGKPVNLCIPCLVCWRRKHK